MSDSEMEKEIVAKGLVYPRITNDEIEKKMLDVKYDCHIVPGTTTTVITAYLPMKHINFTLSTEIMACVDPRNFNAELGEKYGIEKAAKSAKDKLWELEGYRLAYEVANAPATAKDRLVVELKDLDNKLGDLNCYIGTEHYNTLDDISKKLIDDQSVLMCDYVDTLTCRLDAWKD